MHGKSIQRAWTEAWYILVQNDDDLVKMMESFSLDYFLFLQ